MLHTVRVSGKWQMKRRSGDRSPKECSPFTKLGEFPRRRSATSPMRVMTRMGDVALRRLGNSPNFVKGLHSLGDLSPERRFICHFPETRTVWSIGSGYGGNALLAKKCHA